MAQTLKERTTIALIWSFIDRFGQQLIYFITGIYLARVLSVDDYGLMGSLIFFSALSISIIGSGYSRALINKKTVDPSDYQSVFIYNAVTAVLFYFLLFFSAPAIAQFFGQPQLVQLARVMFLGVLFTALQIVQETSLSKNMDLNRIARSNIFGLLPASILAIIAAHQGLGVWALVIQSVGYSFFKMCFIWYYGRWKPGGHFKIARLKEMFPFSSRVMLTSLINAVFNNLLYLIIGRFYQVTQLGYYTQANKYQEIPNSLVSYTFRNIAIPLLSSVNHEDERLERILHKLVKTAAFFTFPVFFGLILIAKPLFIVLITEKWLASVPIFQILCISGVFNVFNYLFQEAILSKGHSKAILYLEIFKRALFVGLILLTIKKGVLGLAAGWTISSLLSTFLSLLITNRLVHYRIRDFIKDSLPYFVLSLVLCLSAALLFRFISQPWILLISSITGVALLYLFISYQLHLEAANETFSWLRDRWHRKQS